MGAGRFWDAGVGFYLAQRRRGAKGMPDTTLLGASFLVADGLTAKNVKPELPDAK